MRVFFVTTNKHKAYECEALVRELRAGRDIEVVHVDRTLDEVLATDLQHLIRDKAKQAWDQVRAPVFVEHGGLQIDYFGGLPGTLIKPFWATLGAELGAKIPEGASRRAVALRATCYCNGRTRVVFDEQRSGAIAEHPTGTEGFHWDPFFVPDDQPDPARPGRTYAQMSREEKLWASGGRKVLGALIDHLDKEKAGWD
ncbi:MAG: hypothetical protein K0V04_10025 [Deltaproteobacteria bacterium]|nr:hypothetical protein [Deltaproteobacteria bacterium]